MMVLLVIINLFTSFELEAFHTFVTQKYSEQKSLLHHVESHKTMVFQSYLLKVFKSDEMLIENPSLLFDAFDNYISNHPDRISKTTLKEMFVTIQKSEEPSFNQMLYVQMVGHHLQKESIPVVAAFLSDEKLKNLCLTVLNDVTNQEIQLLGELKDIEQY